MTNEEYVIARNKLIPLAKRFANNAVGTGKGIEPGPELNAWRNAWDLAFHSQMTKLARDAGLTK